nr:reverse transcriptase domain-containing protein [Tanacetum cinerariifolium]
MEVNANDMVIKSDSKEVMLAEIKETFGRLWTINLKLNPRECSFRVEEGISFGYLVTKQGIKADPSKQVLAKPEKSGHVAKWAIELGEHEIKFKGRNSIKGHILADFLIETSSRKREEEKDEGAKRKEPEPENTWKLFINEALSSDGSGAG